LLRWVVAEFVRTGHGKKKEERRKKKESLGENGMKPGVGAYIMA